MRGIEVIHSIWELAVFPLSFPTVKPCIPGFSRWDYVLSVVAQSIDDYIDTTRQIRTDNRGILRDHTELINIIEISGHEDIAIRSWFCSEEVEETFYLSTVYFWDYNGSAAGDFNEVSRADLNEGSISGPVLPTQPEVDTSKYHVSPTVQERIMYLLGTCTETEADWSYDSQLNRLVKYRNALERPNEILAYANYNFEYIFRMDEEENFSPYGGYCDGGEAIDIVPEDEVEGMKFVD